MAVVVAATAGTVTSASSVSSAKASRSTSGRRAAAVGVRRLSVHGGLKAQNEVTALGLSLSTEQQFANVRARCAAPSSGSSKKGGALTSTCDQNTSLIFTVAPLISVLVLVGIAVGFLLLRVEAAIEDSD